AKRLSGSPDRVATKDRAVGEREQSGRKRRQHGRLLGGAPCADLSIRAVRAAARCIGGCARRLARVSQQTSQGRDGSIVWTDRLGAVRQPRAADERYGRGRR